MKTRLQLLENGLDSLGVLFRMCLKWFQAKRTRQFAFGNGSADDALFWAEMVISVFKDV